MKIILMYEYVHISYMIIHIYEYLCMFIHIHALNIFYSNSNYLQDSNYFL